MVSVSYHQGMAMTLRLDESETAALRTQADLEHRSMQEIARTAVREYLDRHSRAESIDRIMDAEFPKYAEAFERLGQ